MQDFRIDRFLVAFEHVARVRGRIENARPEVRRMAPRRDLPDVIEFFSEMEAVLRETRELNLRVPEKYAQRLLDKANSGSVYSELEKEITNFTERFIDHFEERKVLLLAGDNSQYYEQTGPIIERLIDRFPDKAAVEMKEAGKCLALGLDTACVFHAMRAIEAAIFAIMKCLDVTSEYPTWGMYIKAIKAGIAGRNKGTSPGWSNAKDSDTFNDFLLTLQTIKSLYRDPTMHVEKTYMPDEAEKIFGQTRLLMDAVCKRMN